MMIRALTCIMLIASSVASRFRVKSNVSSATAVKLEDLEDTWLSIWNSRSGSYFAEDDAVFVVEKDLVRLEGDTEHIFGKPSSQKDTIILKTDANDIWSLAGSESSESECSAWNEYFKLVQTMKEARKDPPPGMYSLAQTQEAVEVLCVDWTFAGEVKPPPSGMYSLAEVAGVGTRTMHWLKKPPPSEDEIAAMIEEAIFAMAAELLLLSPTSSSVEQKLAWVSKATHRLLSLPDDENLKATQNLLWKWINSSKFDLGMTKKLKSAIVQRIVQALIPLKSVVEVKYSGEDV
jgi:hypothetical protein